MAAKNPTGPRSSEHASNHHDPGFDPDSPDLADPQVDPVGPARAPLDQPEPEHQRKRSRAYDPLANLRKWLRRADMRPSPGRSAGVR